MYGLNNECFLNKNVLLIESCLMLRNWCEEEYLKGAFSKSTNGEHAERFLRNVIRNKVDKTYETLIEQGSTTLNIFNFSVGLVKMVKDVTPRSWLTVVSVKFTDSIGAFHKKNTESYAKERQRETAISKITIDYEFFIDRFERQPWIDLTPIALALNCLPGINIAPDILCQETVKVWLNLNNVNGFKIGETSANILVEGHFTGNHIAGNLDKESVSKSYLGSGGSKIQFGVAEDTISYNASLAPIFRIELRPWKSYDWVSNDIEHTADIIKSHLELNR